MSSVKTPNFKTTEEYSCSRSWNGHDNKVLPAGSFVRPIELMHVPKEIKNDWIGFNRITHVFVYCRFGILPMPRNIIREV